MVAGCKSGFEGEHRPYFIRLKRCPPRFLLALCLRGTAHHQGWKRRIGSSTARPLVYGLKSPLFPIAASTLDSPALLPGAG